MTDEQRQAEWRAHARVFRDYARELLLAGDSERAHFAELNARSCESLGGIPVGEGMGEGSVRSHHEHHDEQRLEGLVRVRQLELFERGRR